MKIDLIFPKKSVMAVRKALGLRALPAIPVKKKEVSHGGKQK